MEKRKPHYSLKAVQKIVADPKSRPFTKTAIEGGKALGLDTGEMRTVVLAATGRQFYKSMTVHGDSAVWQDVYHAVTADGDGVYLKITQFEDARPPVIQFKALENGKE